MMMILFTLAYTRSSTGLSAAVARWVFATYLARGLDKIPNASHNTKHPLDSQGRPNHGCVSLPLQGKILPVSRLELLFWSSRNCRTETTHGFDFGTRHSVVPCTDGHAVLAQSAWVPESFPPVVFKMYTYKNCHVWNLERIW